jgi:hypothetical protein
MHQNSYRSNRPFCFGEWRPAVQLGVPAQSAARQGEAKQIELAVSKSSTKLDPDFYILRQKPTPPGPSLRGAGVVFGQPAAGRRREQ